MLHALRSMLPVPVPNLLSRPNISTDKFPKKGTKKSHLAMQYQRLNLIFFLFLCHICCLPDHRTFLAVSRSIEGSHIDVFIPITPMLVSAWLSYTTLYYHQMSPKPLSTWNLQRGHYLFKQIEPWIIHSQTALQLDVIYIRGQYIHTISFSAYLCHFMWQRVIDEQPLWFENNAHQIIYEALITT